MQIINICFYSNLLFYCYSTQGLLVQFTKVNKIFALHLIVMLIVCLLHIMSHLNISIEGKQQVPTKFNVRITYPPLGQQVPIGYGLTIFGTSIYDTTSHDCTVYANSNDSKFQRVVAVGPTGNNDYSSWIFTYDKNYHPITKGLNKLTAKISCKANPMNLTAYYITNVTGIIERNNINNLDQQGYRSSNIPGSVMRTNSNANIHAFASPYGNVSIAPFWFPNLFHNDISNINHNSVPQSSKALGISIKVGKNPIAWGNKQTIKITTFDPNSNRPISNAIVQGAITFPSLSTGITRGFTIATDNLGTASYSWLIGDNNAKVGIYNLAIRASAFGYNTTSASTSFTVMPILYENDFQHKTNNNNSLNRTIPSISTLHTGLAG